MIKERVTVEFDEESYYLDGKYWESWDNFGEEMAEAINKLLDKQDKQIFLLKSVIQNITAESYDTGSISRKRITEIKDYWYKKIIEEVEE